MAGPGKHSPAWALRNSAGRPPVDLAEALSILIKPHAGVMRPDDDMHDQPTDLVDAVHARVAIRELEETHVVLQIEEGHLHAIGPYPDGYQAEAAAQALRQLDAEDREPGDAPLSYQAVALCAG